MFPLIVSLQVASSPEIDLGDDDDPDQVEIMLRVMYDDDTVYGLNVLYMKDPNFTKALLDYYVLGDKYDFPVLRQQAKKMFIREIQGDVSLQSDNGIWTSEIFENTAKSIAMVLGPSAITFADRSIQKEVLEWCAMHFDELLWHRYFRKLLGKGRVFSTEFIGRILLMKARVDHVEFGYDVDNDVYGHSSADEDNTQSKGGSEPEAEENNDDEEDNDDESNDDEEDDDDESNDDAEESNDNDGILQVREHEVEEELGSNA
jgi:hypothetical protein